MNKKYILFLKLILSLTIHGMDNQAKNESNLISLPDEIIIQIIKNSYDINEDLINIITKQFSSLNKKISLIIYLSNNIKTYNNQHSTQYTLNNYLSWKNNNVSIQRIDLLNKIDKKEINSINNNDFNELHNIPKNIRAELLSNNSNIIVESPFSLYNSSIQQIPSIAKMTFTGAIIGVLLTFSQKKENIYDNNILLTGLIGGSACGAAIGTGLAIPKITTDYENNSTAINKSLLLK